jgi:hypothetical protein
MQPISALTPSFHPTLHIHLNLTDYPIKCQPVLSFTFPDMIFPDPDELRDRLLPSYGINEWYLSVDEVDVERPERSKATSNTLTIIMDPGGNRDLELPLHARYPKPHESGRKDLELFDEGEGGRIGGGWICDHLGTGEPLVISSAQPLTDPPILDTIHHAPIHFQLPAGRPSHQPLVESITTFSIWISFSWLVYKMIRLSQRNMPKAQ